MLWWYNSMVGSMFFFKQKTAYELRISDWSSDVCSSDLLGAMFAGYLFHDGFIGHHWKEFWGEAILVLDDHKALENMHHVPFLVMIAPLVVGLVGIAVAWYAYIRDPDLPRRAAKQQVVLYQFLLNKWYLPRSTTSFSSARRCGTAACCGRRDRQSTSLNSSH